MSDRDAFIAAITAEPDDSRPRLIFADWLDENGEPEWAEFTRVQCEMARLEARKASDGRSVGLRDRHWEPSFVRERELLLSKSKGWSHFGLPRIGGTCWRLADRWGDSGLISMIEGPVWKEIPVGQRSASFTIDFRRGFIEQVECAWEDWQSHAAVIRAAVPIRKVRLTTLPSRAEVPAAIFEGDGSAIRTWLAMTYPGVEFDLFPFTNAIRRAGATFAALRVSNAINLAFDRRSMDALTAAQQSPADLD